MNRLQLDDPTKIYKYSCGNEIKKYGNGRFVEVVPEVQAREKLNVSKVISLDQYLIDLENL